MSDTWWIDTGSKVQGPFSTSKICEYAAAGRLKPSMKLSRDRQSWLPWNDVEALLAPVADSSELEDEPGAAEEGKGRGKPGRRTMLGIAVLLVALVLMLAFSGESEEDQRKRLTSELAALELVSIHIASTHRDRQRLIRQRGGSADDELVRESEIAFLEQKRGELDADKLHRVREAFQDYIDALKVYYVLVEKVVRASDEGDVEELERLKERAEEAAQAPVKAARAIDALKRGINAKRRALEK